MLTAVLDEADAKAAAPPSGHHSDAKLLEACESFAQAAEALKAVNALPLADVTDEMIASIVAAWSAPIDTIIASPATSIQGIRAKAQAVIHAFETGGVEKGIHEPVEEAAGYHEMMAGRLCHEILAMGAAA